MKSDTGFTLVELLIVISIISVLLTIAFSTYTGIQRRARDTRRQVDIDSISKALETHKPSSNTFYLPLLDNQFSAGVVPHETNTPGFKYCISVNTSTNIPPTTPTDWAATLTCPPSWVEVSTSSITANTALAWRVCARLESSTGDTSLTGLQLYCKTSL